MVRIMDRIMSTLVVGFSIVLLAVVNCMLGAQLIAKKLGDAGAAYAAPAGVIAVAVAGALVLPVLVVVDDKPGAAAGAGGPAAAVKKDVA